MSGFVSVLSLTTLPQKLLLGALAAALAVAGTYNVVQTIENRQLSAENGKLDKRINDPKTGYVVTLTQAEANVGVCTAAIGRQNDAIEAVSSKSVAAVAAVQARYDVEHAARVRAENSSAAFLAREPRGATLAERVTDVDAQILGDLK